MKNRGFTLAEVLITIGIVGVVAALTIPALVADYKNKVAITQLKKIYSVLSQSMELASLQDGGFSSISVKNDSQESINNWFQYYIKPNIKVTKECYNEKGCWAKNVKTLGGSTPYYSRGEIGIGSDIVLFNTADGYAVNLDVYDYRPERFGVNLGSTSSAYFLVFVDVNGNKLPNVVGKDIFVLVYVPERGLVPAGRDLSDEEVNANCTTSDKSNTGGYYCMEKIIRSEY